MENIVAGIITVFAIVVTAWGHWYESYGPDEDEVTANEKMYGKPDILNLDKK